MSKLIVSEFEILDHGIENSQYFPGCGVCLTDFDDVATGIGDNFREALENALDQLAQMNYNVENVKAEDDEQRDAVSVSPQSSVEDIYYYVSIRVKGE